MELYTQEKQKYAILDQENEELVAKMRVSFMESLKRERNEMTYWREIM